VNPSHGRAVYLSVPIGFGLPAFTVAQRLSEAGALVFLDEPTGSLEQGEARRSARHIPPAICYADELLVLLPKPSNAANVSDADIFPPRHFLVIALTGARIRSIGTTVFLPAGLTREFVKGSTSAPPFLMDGHLLEESSWDEYYRQLGKNLPASHRDFIQLDQGLRVCLCWVSDMKRPGAAKKEGERLQNKLKKFGLDSDLVVWTRDGASTWTPNQNPNENFDALAVCARGDESGPWNDPRFRKLFDRVVGERCPVVFVRREAIACSVPADFAVLPQLECFPNAPEPQILALVRALIGFKDWRSAEKPATQEPLNSSAPVDVLQLDPASAPPRAVLLPERVRSTVSEVVTRRSLPEPYAVFCRIEASKNRAADQQAVAADVLDSAVDSLQTGSVEVLYGPNGRFVLVSKVTEALDLAVRLHKECAANGVQLATGLANGPVVKTRDLNGPGKAGPVLNRAARLAHVDRGAGRTAVDSHSRNDAYAASDTYRKQLGRLTGGTVKRTQLEFHWLKHPALAFGSLPSPDKTYYSELAHIVVYDMARFSEQKPEDLAVLANDMNNAARRALVPGPGLDSMTNGTRGWYIPGGDGGVLIFRAEEEGAAHAAWQFVTNMLHFSTSMVKLPIRIGVATGQVVNRGQKPPVGSGIDDADTLSANAQKGKPCVHVNFWRERLDEHDRWNWAEEPVPDRKDALLVHHLGGIPPAALELDIPEEELDRRAENFHGRPLNDLIAEWERRK